MLRCGKIFASLSISKIGNADMKRILIYPEVKKKYFIVCEMKGHFGFLPNLDLINVATASALLQGCS